MAKLSDINKHAAGFELPENYFDDFRQNLQTKLAEEYIQNHAGNDNPFIVPETYFTEFPTRLKSKLKPAVIPLFRPVLSVAAAFILILLLSHIFLSDINDKPQYAERIELQPATLNIKSELVIDTDIEDVIIENYLADIDAVSVAEYLDEEPAELAEIPVSDEELLDYMADYMAYNDILEEYN